MKKLLLIILSIFTLNSCNKNDDNDEIDATTIDLITGINFRQTFDDTPLSLGNPNNHTNNIFVIYPNPSIDFLSIASNENITKVWIMPGNPNKIHQQTDFSTIYSPNTYTESQIQTKSLLELNDLNSTNVLIDLNSLNTGYYRVFLKINDAIYWDNIYLEKNGDENSINEIINFWN
ncbi:hypothetical protein [uncultured Flavobacterium sp.]|uniref:hypothetical protein n=1 Tax=uncultured Flavobacterium sp. TaxID=165435 RepID=UPI0030C87DE5